MHTKEALNIGETQQRIFLLNAWKETDLFNEEEKAILTLTEEITHISQHGASETAYKKAQQFFNAQTIAEIIMAAVIINAWNRILISTLAPIAG